MFVYCLHCLIPCKEGFGFNFTHIWQIPFMTPAWAGVWIFMIISGFLTGGGFFSGKYELTPSGIAKYYWNRFLNVLFPTYIFISIAAILLNEVTPITYKLLWDGAPVTGIAWTVFTLAWLYLYVPLFVYVFRKLEERFAGNELKLYARLFALVCMAGLVFRLSVRVSGIPWGWVYSGVPGNLDLFIGGMTASRARYFLSDEASLKIKKAASRSVIYFVVLVLVNEAIYFYGERSYELFDKTLIAIYRYLFPTLYLILSAIILAASKETRNLSRFNKFMRWFAGLTLQIYFWHPTITRHLAYRLDIPAGFTRYLAVLILGFILTCYTAYVMTAMQRSLTQKLRSCRIWLNNF